MSDKEYVKKAEEVGYKAEGVDIRKHIHTKVKISCAKCGDTLDACDVLKDRLIADSGGEWVFLNVATKEVSCRKCRNDTFRIFEVIDKRM